MIKLFIHGFVVLFASIVNITDSFAGQPPIFPGSYSITYFLDPDRTTGATQCLVYTLVPGTVGGEPLSGTWTSPTFPGWSGEWVQIGDHVRWYGVVGELVTHASGNLANDSYIGGVSFNHFGKFNAVTTSSGTWHGVRVTSCDSPSNKRKHENNDPAKLPL